MTPRATTVDEEGVLIDNLRLVERGRFREEALMRVLTEHAWPARNPAQNVADLRAQIAANEKGVQEMRRMVEHFGLDVVTAYMGHVQDNAAESVRRVISALHDSEFAVETDQGAVIRVKITVDRDKRQATVDFTGTSPEQASNFNAPEPVTRAAVLYCFRVMVEGDIPMNAGCLRPINIVIPEGSMLSPRYPAAVVAGNVETSQHVTDCLFGALGALASAQGSMNNLTFGNDRYQYYETICSGAPAGVLERRQRLRRRRRRPHPHDQFAPDRPGDPRIPFSRPARGFPHPGELRRQGQMARRRRHGTHAALPGRDGLRHPLLAPQGAAARACRRRTGGIGHDPRAPRRRHDRDACRLRPDADSSPARR